MAKAYQINESLTGAWSKVLDKDQLFRLGDLDCDATKEADLSYTNGGAVETVIGSSPQLFALPRYKELWARAAGGVGTAELRGTLLESPSDDIYHSFEGIWYKGRDLEMVIRGSASILRVDSGGQAEYESIQDAIDAAPTDAVVEIAPGTYTENVVLARGVNLRGLGGGFGPRKDVVIVSATGDTLQVPHRDCTINGISIQSSSPNPADTALRIIDDGLGAGLETFCLFFHAESLPGAQAQAIHADVLPLNENAILLWAGVDADSSAPIAVELDSFVVWFLGGMGGNGAQIGVKMNPGSGFMAGAQVGLNADLVAGRVIDADGGFGLFLDCTMDGFNGIRGQNGSTLVLGKVQSFGGMAGTPLDTDVTSAVFMGSEVLEGFGGAAWSGFSVLGSALRVWKGVEGGGTIGLGGPDQRPTVGGNTVPLGFRFTASDITPGTPGLAGTGGDLTYFPGVGWKDTTGAIHP